LTATRRVLSLLVQPTNRGDLRHAVSVPEEQ
jgi:hypothetical protein